MHDLMTTSAWNTAEVMRLPWNAAPCPCVGRHIPKPVMVEKHHVLPKQLQVKLWGVVRDNTTVPCCSNAHESIHALLDLLLAGKPMPPHANAYHREIALRGYTQYQLALKPPAER